MGCDLQQWAMAQRRWGFNPRTRMGCDQPLLRFRAIPVCFNPRTRMGCDFRHVVQIDFIQSFNPRTRMGCDFRHVVQIDFIQSFNPRTRMGCDESLLALGRGGAVSIHAPAWGATQLNNRNTEALKFQSTHPHGVRPTTSITIAIPINSFNPRTRMGCDLIHCIQSFQTGCFNPRTRMGCDVQLLFLVLLLPLFQSTHPHGVRR